MSRCSPLKLCDIVRNIEGGSLVRDQRVQRDSSIRQQPHRQASCNGGVGGGHAERVTHASDQKAVRVLLCNFLVSFPLSDGLSYFFFIVISLSALYTRVGCEGVLLVLMYVCVVVCMGCLGVVVVVAAFLFFFFFKRHDGSANTRGAVCFYIIIVRKEGRKRQLRCGVRVTSMLVTCFCFFVDVSVYVCLIVSMII
jgi:hypothetical protein